MPSSPLVFVLSFLFAAPSVAAFILLPSSRPFLFGAERGSTSTTTVRMSGGGGVPLVEGDALQILKGLKEGTLSYSDLLGPLFGSRELTASPKGFWEGDPPALQQQQQQQQSAEEEHVDPPPYPMDEYNRLLVSNSGPQDYVNPEPLPEYDLVVIGAGVAGLLSVIIGKSVGMKCAMIERSLLGGDCLNIGCVPSKALIACAKRLQDVREASEMGVVLPGGEVTVDFGAVMQRMRRIRSEISHHDSVARYSRDFCEHVFLGQARFSSSHSVTVGGKELKFRKAMVASGGRARSVELLEGLPHLTNASLFNLVELPPRMVVIGAGPIGLEMAQSFQRFGCRVTCLQKGDRILPHDDPEAAELLLERLKAEGLDIRTGVRIVEVRESTAGKGNLYHAPWNSYAITVESTDENGGGAQETFHCDAVLSSAGRVPNVRGMALEEVGVAYDEQRGVWIDEFFQTTAPDIYSCGDCAAPHKFTHSADWQARLAIRNMLGDKGRYTQLLIPHATYTHPEVASVGRTEAQLREQGAVFETYYRAMAEVDRCRCEGVQEGFVKMFVNPPTGQILGATIVAPEAGSMISEITLAMQCNISVGTLGGVIHPYPTAQEAVRQAAGQFNKNFRTPAVNEAVALALDAMRKNSSPG
jgi:pyruvate/2-oxoglutarate dehydrogenase complex dihydrolipoamide dehydrogenase (E3) component